MKLRKRKSDLLFRMLQPALITFSVTQYLDNFHLKIPHEHICHRSLKIRSSSLKLQFGTGQSSLDNCIEHRTCCL